MAKKKHRAAINLLITITTLSTLWGCFGFYCADYYRALSEADDALISATNLAVTKGDWLTAFEPSSKKSLGYIFYPGGKVESKAYAPFCRALSEKGNPTYLVTMPYNLAFFHSDAANGIIAAHPEVSSWVLIGHSLGGAMAGAYAAQNNSRLNGIVFLAAYTPNDLSQTPLKSLTIYGSEDGVMNREKYREAYSLLPLNNKEIVIAGGNHASFGLYGEQAGDGKATIKPDEQIQKSVDAIDSYFGK
jgi:dienelactone hydrolase